MINPRDIREQAQARIRALPPAAVTEDLIHELYVKLIYEALEPARHAIVQLDDSIERCRVRNPKEGWTMVSAEQREELHGHVKALRAMVQPY